MVFRSIFHEDHIRTVSVSAMDKTKSTAFGQPKAVLFILLYGGQDQS